MNASLVQSSPEEKKKVTGKLEDTLYCAKVGHITIFIVLSVWNEMIAVSSLLTKTSSASLKSITRHHHHDQSCLQYERKYQISNGAFSSVFCIKRRGNKNKTLYAAKVSNGHHMSLSLSLFVFVFVCLCLGLCTNKTLYAAKVSIICTFVLNFFLSFLLNV